MTIELKTKVIEALKIQRASFSGSDAKYATKLGIAAAQLSRIMNGELEKVISDTNWISLARIVGVNLTNKLDWKVANTPMYSAVTNVLTHCKKESVCGILCDEADTGKTFSAKSFVKTNKNSIYIDCSQVKSKQKLVRAIAKEFGVGHTGKYNDVYDDLVYYIQSLTNPLVVLDEAGDLNYDAFLELKALWNATEGYCAWFMIGADGLKEKIRRAINNKKVGYTELFSRFGARYIRITPEGKDDYTKFSKTQAGLIINANKKQGIDTQKIMAKTQGSLRRIKTELSKN